MFFLLLQYTLNFIVYASRSEQYRKAYLRYLKVKLPSVFGNHDSQIHSTIFIINPGRRPASDLELYKKQTNKKKNIDVKLKDFEN